jgi:serine/threonine protein kinase
MKCSPESRDLLNKLLEFDSKKRISAENALNHKWSKMFDDKDINQQSINDCLIALKNFNTEQKL